MNDSKPTSKPVTPPGFGPRGLLLGSRWCPLYVVIWPGDADGLTLAYGRPPRIDR
jgi:hypothetical protein